MAHGIGKGQGSLIIVSHAVLPLAGENEDQGNEYQDRGPYP